MANVPVRISRAIVQREGATGSFPPPVADTDPVITDPLNPPGSGGGVGTFVELTDTPDNYVGEAGKIIAVKGDESGLEYVPNTAITTHNDLSGLQGGSATERYHLTKDQFDAVDGANNPDSGNVFATLADLGNAGFGTVTSVGLSAPDIFSVANSPITTAGTLAISLVNQSAFHVFARGSGSGVPSFQALVADHIPNLAISKITGLQTALDAKLGEGLLSARIFVGNASGIAEGRILTLNATGGNFGLSNTGQLTFPNASASARGLLTSSDWNTFNGKQNALGFTPENVANKSTSTSLGTSNTLYPSQNAVKVYVDNQIATREIAFSKGNIVQGTGLSLSGTLTSRLVGTGNVTFAVNFGTTVGTVAQGNDQRILNGDIAFGWGDFRDFGLGQVSTNTVGSIADYDLFDRPNSFIRATSAADTPFSNAGTTLNLSYSSTAGMQLHFAVNANRIEFRRANNSVWSSVFELWHSGNFDPDTKLDTTLTSAQIFVGNSSNVATARSLSLNASGGTFGLSNTGVLTFPNASGSARGLLTSADWTTFNNKSNLALGETSTTAYRGDRGKTAFDYSQVGHLPLSGGTLTGIVKFTLSSLNQIEFERSTSDNFWAFGQSNNGDFSLIRRDTSGTEIDRPIVIKGSNGNTLIGTTTELTGGGRLQVNGTVNCDNPTADRHAVTRGWLNTNFGLRTAGDTGIGAVKYNGSTQQEGQFYGGTTDPNPVSANIRTLNFDGSFQASEFSTQKPTLVAILNNASHTFNTLNDGAHIVSVVSSGSNNVNAIMIGARFGSSITYTLLSSSGLSISTNSNGFYVITNTSGSNQTVKIRALMLNQK